MDRSEALAIVHEYVKNQGLVNHMLSVEAAMRHYAQKLNQDVEMWGLAGLLHDFDWEIHPTLEEHPLAGAPMLRERGVPEEIVHAILAHGEETGVPRDTLLDKALYACDEITGLITAVALVRPSRSLYDLSASSVKKKWKDKAFAAGANREEITRAAAEFNVDLWQHVDEVILARDTSLRLFCQNPQPHAHTHANPDPDRNHHTYARRRGYALPRANRNRGAHPYPSPVGQRGKSPGGWDRQRRGRGRATGSSRPVCHANQRCHRLRYPEPEFRFLQGADRGAASGHRSHGLAPTVYLYLCE